MMWYWIVLIVIGYFIIGSLCAIITGKINDDIADEFTKVMMILFWPIIIPALLGINAIMLLYRGLETVINEITKK